MKLKKLPKKIKLVKKPTRPGVKIALVLMVLCAGLAALTLTWLHQSLVAQTGKLRDQAAAVDYANGEIQHRIDNPDDPTVIADIARDELGLMDPDTIVLDPQG